MFVSKIEVMGDSGKTYSLNAYPDGVVYCSCPAWQFAGGAPIDRTCKHIKFLKRSLRPMTLVDQG